MNYLKIIKKLYHRDFSKTYNMKKSIYILLVVSFMASAYSQTKKVEKADKKYADLAYIDAIATYEKVAQKATEIALKVSEAFNHVGLLAVEMFQTEEDEILVNEVAPRPHNSGHYSIEASYTSQFENHLRAILNLPLGTTDSKVAGIMVNLVGEEGFSGQVIYENIEKIMAIDGVTPHIYGKRETRPFRKMGHVTIVNENMVDARKIAEEVKNSIRVIC